ncbi:hypothetical protein [Oscillibacter sp.]|uniref:hypothetical protein n=1 Tax=Oscillibacter sp. TaxID=1945593 RepID=UPI00339B409E
MFSLIQEHPFPSVFNDSITKIEFAGKVIHPNSGFMHPGCNLLKAQSKPERPVGAPACVQLPFSAVIWSKRFYFPLFCLDFSFAFLASSTAGSPGIPEPEEGMTESLAKLVAEFIAELVAKFIAELVAELVDFLFS